MMIKSRLPVASRLNSLFSSWATISSRVKSMFLKLLKSRKENHGNPTLLLWDKAWLISRHWMVEAELNLMVPIPGLRDTGTSLRWTTGTQFKTQRYERTCRFRLNPPPIVNELLTALPEKFNICNVENN
eukprot:Protomagalhaensia_wolfi_Nauph_80__1131@NODE_1667_length_1408_cov_20_663258_g1293_i0_p1_GENE_NODE_1667_length_1408_cov_20_663258_g1293_i0NODE_1667_length_1408_cov_20_663258_g1293_i0_p1_ORF_typecomplete_len129_score10_95DNA_pol_delta_4/PF04081_13/0_014_NODE_1667_length_1408_cov_20_663258_g1293_i0395781